MAKAESKKDKSKRPKPAGAGKERSGSGKALGWLGRLRGAPKEVLIAACASVALFVALLFLVDWPEAISIASGLWVFTDASLMRITRVKPSSKGFRLAAMVWGIFGFVPLVGIGIYAYLRGALCTASPKDIAPPSMSDEKMKEAGKFRARRVSVPGAVAVVVLAATLGFAARYESMTLEFGTSIIRRTLRIDGSTPGDRYYTGTIAVKLSSLDAADGYDRLDWKLHLLGKGGGPVRKGTVKARRSSEKTIWTWKVRARAPGKYRLDVLREDGKVLKRGYFSARKKR